VLALAAAEEGHQVEVALLGEAAYLVKDKIADQIQGVGFPALRELLPKAIEHGIQIHV
jgi:predicted peroxiredoxin